MSLATRLCFFPPPYEEQSEVKSYNKNIVNKILLLKQLQTRNNLTYDEIIHLLDMQIAMQIKDNDEHKEEYLINIENLKNIKSFIDKIKTFSRPPDSHVSPRTSSYFKANQEITSYTLDFLLELLDSNKKITGTESELDLQNFTNKLITTMEKFQQNSGYTQRYASRDIKSWWELVIKCGWAIIKALILCALTATLGGIGGRWTESYLYNETIGQSVKAIMTTTGAYTGAITAGAISLFYSINSFIEAYETFKNDYKTHINQKKHIIDLIEIINNYSSCVLKTLKGQQPKA